MEARRITIIPITRTVVKKKATRLPHAPKAISLAVKNAPMETITPNVFRLAQAITWNVMNPMSVLVKPVTANTLLAPVHLVARNILIPLFLTVICKTEKPVWIVTDKPNTKLKSIPATALWIAALWAARPERRVVNRETPPNMTTANLVRTWAR